MEKHLVSVIRYEKPFTSVKKAVLACNGFAAIPRGARIFIKPNIVFWTKACTFPKWGVITTSRVIEDIVILLKEHSLNHITIGEGIVTHREDQETPVHAFRSLGYEKLSQHYGVKFVNIMAHNFRRVDLGDGISLKFSEQILDSDFLVNLPVLKTHNQTVVSLGIKNLKGTIDVASRKKCHSADPNRDLHFHIARLADKMPPTLTLIDGIYSLERGPAFDGRIRRNNLLVASRDILSADMIGAKLLGYDPGQVPHLVWAARNRQRPTDLSCLEIVGDKLADVISPHKYDVDYCQNETGEMPRALAKQGITGLFYRKYDSSMCTYCSAMNGLILSAIRLAWKGRPFDRIEVLTGKIMKPAPGMHTTILIGECMYKANRKHPHINKLVAVKGCPPEPVDVARALSAAGIEVDPTLFKQIDSLPGYFMSRYEGKEEFDESFFQIR